jgi:glycosyltransferase involved in cell wall biosynthesis
MKLSIVVPFYSEAKNAPLVLEEFKKFQDKYDFELICVDNGSKDDTAKILEEARRSGEYPFIRIVTIAVNDGYGNGIMTGIRSVKGDVVAWTHGDLQTPVADVFKAYDLYRSNVHNSSSKILIKGWRINRTAQQVVLSFGMAIIASVILRRKLIEINAQPKLFPKELVSLLQDAPKDFSLDLYLLCIAQNNGYKIETVRVRFPDRLHGESSWAFSWKSKWKGIWCSIKYIWKLRKEI